jgi:hypothetical protein
MQIRKILLAAAVAAAFTLPAHVMAQQSSQTVPPGYTNPETGAAEIDDAMLEKFAAVHEKVEAVSMKYQADMQKAEDADARNKLALKGNEEMQKVIESSPLSVLDYNRIAMLVQHDPELQQKYLEHVKK